MSQSFRCDAALDQNDGGIIEQRRIENEQQVKRVPPPVKHVRAEQEPMQPITRTSQRQVHRVRDEEENCERPRVKEHRRAGCGEGGGGEQAESRGRGDKGQSRFLASNLRPDRFEPRAVSSPFPKWGSRTRMKPPENPARERLLKRVARILACPHCHQAIAPAHTPGPLRCAACWQKLRGRLRGRAIRLLGLPKGRGAARLAQPREGIGEAPAGPFLSRDVPARGPRLYVRSGDSLSNELRHRIGIGGRFGLRHDRVPRQRGLRRRRRLSERARCGQSRTPAVSE